MLRAWLVPIKQPVVVDDVQATVEDLTAIQAASNTAQAKAVRNHSNDVKKADDQDKADGKGGEKAGDGKEEGGEIADDGKEGGGKADDGKEKERDEEEKSAASEEEEAGNCAVCQQGGDEDRLLLCDACDVSTHTYCDDPPLAEVPGGDWFCAGCRKRGADTAAKRPQRSSTSLLSSDDDSDDDAQRRQQRLSRLAKRVRSARTSSRAGGKKKKRSASSSSDEYVPSDENDDDDDQDWVDDDCAEEVLDDDEEEEEEKKKKRAPVKRRGPTTSEEEKAKQPFDSFVNRFQYASSSVPTSPRSPQAGRGSPGRNSSALSRTGGRGRGAAASPSRIVKQPSSAVDPASPVGSGASKLGSFRFSCDSSEFASLKQSASQRQSLAAKFD